MRSWTRVTTTGAITGRGGSHMAYDSNRQRVVLFGGENVSGGKFGDTWEYNPSTSSWTQLAVTGPSPRAYGAFAYDAVRNVTVLFGGNDGSYRNDTWEWNGTAWTERFPTASPSARYFLGAWWDPNRGRVAIFGGYDSSNQQRADTWEWNGTTWTERSLTGPPLGIHSVAYDLLRQRMVLFGGYSFAGPGSSTWELSATNWTQPTPLTSPPRRYGAAMAYDGRSGTVVLVGGYDAAPGSTATMAGAWRYDGSTWTTLSTNLGAQSHGAMVYDSTRQRLIHFGGYGTTVSTLLSDTWEY